MLIPMLVVTKSSRGRAEQFVMGRNRRRLLRRLARCDRHRRLRVYYPAHGPAVTKPAQLVRGMIGHRLQRERQILKLVGEKSRDIPDIVANAYPGLDPRLVPAAGGSVSAHLLALRQRGLVEQAEGDTWTKTLRSD